ncbi:MAG: hypothetical protein ACLUJG_08610 [Lawsonibacter sp.]
MLTAEGAPSTTRCVGLDSGADDYMPKPFGMMELMARIRPPCATRGQAGAGQRRTTPWASLRL